MFGASIKWGESRALVKTPLVKFKKAPKILASRQKKNPKDVHTKMQIMMTMHVGAEEVGRYHVVATIP